MPSVELLQVMDVVFCLPSLEKCRRIFVYVLIGEKLVEKLVNVHSAFSLFITVSA